MHSLFIASNAFHWIGSAAFFLLAGYSLKYRHQPLARALIFFFCLCGLWSTMAACIFVIPGLDEMILLNRIKMVAPVLLPLSIFWLSVCIHGRTQIKPWQWAILAIVPTCSLGMLAFDHTAFINGYQAVPFRTYSILTFQNGPWFQIHNLYSRVLTAFSMWVLFKSRKNFGSFHKRNTWLLIFGILFPLLMDTIAVFVLPELRFAQIVPTCFLGTAGILIYCIFQSRWLEAIPVARDYIVDNLPDAYLVFDNAGALVDHNASARRLFTLPVQCIGKPASTLFKAYPEISATLEGNLPILKELKFLAHDQSTFHLSGLRFHTPSGITKATLLTFKDVTSYKQNQKELQLLNEMKTKLLAIVAHDLISNLRSVAMLTETLVQEQHHKKLSEKETLTIAELLHDSSLQMSEFVEKLLKWSKAQLNLASPVKSRVDLVTLAKQTVLFQEPLAKAKNIALDVHSTSDSIVSADENMILTVLRNLVDNAVKFAPEGSQVKIQIDASEASTQVTIIDQGRGIQKEGIHQFLREESPAEWMRAGMEQEGLGLLICKEFIRLHGGKIWAGATNGEATLCFSLPRESLSI